MWQISSTLAVFVVVCSNNARQFLLLTEWKRTDVNTVHLCYRRLATKRAPQDSDGTWIQFFKNRIGLDSKKNIRSSLSASCTFQRMHNFNRNGIYITLQICLRTYCGNLFKIKMNERLLAETCLSQTLSLRKKHTWHFGRNLNIPKSQGCLELDIPV